VVKGLLIGLLLFSGAVMGITADELRMLAADQDSEEAKRAQRVEAGNLASLVTKDNKKPASAYTPASSNKYSTHATPSARSVDARTPSVKHEQPSSVTAPARDTGNYYVSPDETRSHSKSIIVSDAVTVKMNWGIRLGTWIEARLDRNISSAEPGSVELTTTRDVIGDKRTLQSGTTLFAEKTLNAATKRMELTVKRGITPDGKEFTVRGIVFDPTRISGLAGIYQVDEKGIVEHGASKGLMAGINSAVRSTAGSTPIGAAASGVTDSVMRDSERGVEYNTAPAATIYVAPQSLLIRVEEKF
jgi:hypothetical protein